MLELTGVVSVTTGPLVKFSDFPAGSCNWTKLQVGQQMQQKINRTEHDVICFKQKLKAPEEFCQWKAAGMKIVDGQVI